MRRSFDSGESMELGFEVGVVRRLLHGAQWVFDKRHTVLLVAGLAIGAAAL